MAFVATTMKEAMELSRESWLRNELSSLKSGGRLVWNGQAKIAARSARPGEVSSYKSRTGEVALTDELACST